MSLNIDRNSKILIQGITGNTGAYYSEKMLQHNMQIVAGVSPGRGGEWLFDGKIPVFDTVDAAVEATGAELSVVFAPVVRAYDALIEVAASPIKAVICVTDNVPIKDLLQVKNYPREDQLIILGPGSSGVMFDDGSWIGAMPDLKLLKGKLGIVTRSGPVAFEIISQLVNVGIGISTLIDLGRNQISGTDYATAIEYFFSDQKTDCVLMIGNKGSVLEEKVADFIIGKQVKPIIAYLPGYANFEIKGKLNNNLPISFLTRESSSKINLLKSAGVKIAALPDDISRIFLELK